MQLGFPNWELEFAGAGCIVTGGYISVVCMELVHTSGTTVIVTTFLMLLSIFVCSAEHTFHHFGPF